MTFAVPGTCRIVALQRVKASLSQWCFLLHKVSFFFFSYHTMHSCFLSWRRVHLSWDEATDKDMWCQLRWQSWESSWIKNHIRQVITNPCFLLFIKSAGVILSWPSGHLDTLLPLLQLVFNLVQIFHTCPQLYNGSLQLPFLLLGHRILFRNCTLALSLLFWLFSLHPMNVVTYLAFVVFQSPSDWKAREQSPSRGSMWKWDAEGKSRPWRRTRNKTHNYYKKIKDNSK